MKIVRCSFAFAAVRVGERGRLEQKGSTGETNRAETEKQGGSSSVVYNEKLSLEVNGFKIQVNCPYIQKLVQRILYRRSIPLNGTEGPDTELELRWD